MSIRNTPGDLHPNRENDGIADVPPVSLVMLLRQPHRFTEAELVEAVTRACECTRHSQHDSFVRQRAEKSLICLQPHLITLLSSDNPYLGRDPQEFSKTLPLPAQRRAWAEHSAWAAIDYLRGGADEALGYAVLAAIAMELIDSNCTGVYFPRERSMIPAGESLRPELSKLAASFSDD